MRISFTPTGRAQFLAAVRFIRRHQPAAAHRFRQRAEMELNRLTQFPDSGRVVPGFPDVAPRPTLG